MARYKGKHRKPTPTVGDRAKQVAVVATVAAVPLVGFPAIAQADTLDAIAQCESGGNENASNGSHFGLFQFDLATWRSVGGTGDPRDASAAEQRTRAETLLARRGTQPWDASKSCWSKKVSTSAPKHSSGATAAKPARPTVPRHALVDNRNEDGSGQYTCNAAHFAFEACDPTNVGAVVAYPKYQPVVKKVIEAVAAEADSTGEHIVVGGDTLSEIADANNTTWQALFAKNGAMIDDADLIFPGEHIRL